MRKYIILLLLVVSVAADFMCAVADTERIVLEKVEQHVIYPQTNTTCGLCQTIVEVIEWEVKVANGTLNETISVVKWLCKELGTPPVKAECDFIIHNIQTIINLILQGLYPPLTICKKIGLC